MYIHCTIEENDFISLNRSTRDTRDRKTTVIPKKLLILYTPHPKNPIPLKLGFLFKNLSSFHIPHIKVKFSKIKV